LAQSVLPGVKAEKERAVLVGLSPGPRQRARLEASVDELGLLAKSAGATVVARLIQERTRKDPATLVGRGKLDEIARVARERSANLIVFDDELSPAQQRNVEQVVEVKTLDRTQLILDIFARRARTREGRLQVELAQLVYLLPRLSGKGVLLSRLGGGIGTRGPGETKLETDRRRIRQRIQAVRREIARVRRERETRRESRLRMEAPVVALVGYTNAGKSTLFSALTASAARVSDLLFMTLDPLVRRIPLGGGRDLLLVDTVGFIQKLPHTLVDAFRATLEEVVEADLLLHVLDASAEDVEMREQAVETVLREIGAESRPRLVVLNKADLAPAERTANLLGARPGAVVVSAIEKRGLEALIEKVEGLLGLRAQKVRLLFGSDEARAIAGVYGAGRVLSHEVRGDLVEIEVEMAERMLGRYQERRA
jgi:GTP-binding protein HflX